WGSRSTMTTSCPEWRKATARLAHKVVFPTPPLAETTATTLTCAPAVRRWKGVHQTHVSASTRVGRCSRVRDDRTWPEAVSEDVPALRHGGRAWVRAHGAEPLAQAE